MRSYIWVYMVCVYMVYVYMASYILFVYTWSFIYGSLYVIVCRWYCTHVFRHGMSNMVFYTCVLIVFDAWLYNVVFIWSDLSYGLISGRLYLVVYVLLHIYTYLKIVFTWHFKHMVFWLWSWISGLHYMVVYIWPFDCWSCRSAIVHLVMHLWSVYTRSVFFFLFLKIVYTSYFKRVVFWLWSWICGLQDLLAYIWSFYFWSCRSAIVHMVMHVWSV